MDHWISLDFSAFWTADWHHPKSAVLVAPSPPDHRHIVFSITGERHAVLMALCWVILPIWHTVVQGDEPLNLTWYFCIFDCQLTSPQIHCSRGTIATRLREQPLQHHRWAPCCFKGVMLGNIADATYSWTGGWTTESHLIFLHFWLPTDTPPKFAVFCGTIITRSLTQLIQHLKWVSCRFNGVMLVNFADASYRTRDWHGLNSSYFCPLFMETWYFIMKTLLVFLLKKNGTWMHFMLPKLVR